MSAIEEQLKRIEEKIEKLNEKLCGLDAFIRNNLAKDCSKMSEHIDFVDQVYDTVRTPLNYICNNINYVLGDSTNNMPETISYYSSSDEEDSS